MAYTRSVSPRDLQELRLRAAQRSETPGEFEAGRARGIQVDESGSSFRPCLLAVLGAPYARSTTVAPAGERSPPDDEIEKIASDEVVTSLGVEGDLSCRAADGISRDVKLGADALAHPALLTNSLLRIRPALARLSLRASVRKAG
jgi:hypothetical protein